MAKITRDEKWGRWAGSIDELAEIATKAYDLAQSERTADEPLYFKLDVESRGLDAQYETPDELIKETRDSELAEIDAIGLHVGNEFTAHRDPVSITIRMSRSLGTTLRVVGEHRARVEGAATILTKQLGERGTRRYVDPFYLALGMALVLLFAFLAVVAALPGQERNEGLDPTLSDLGITFGVVAATATVIFTVYRFFTWIRPRLELVPTGKPTRWQRTRGRVFAVAVFLAAAFAGVVLERLL